MSFTVLYFLASGVLAGVLAGLFGIGGGIILVPLLIYGLKLPHHTANGTSLVALLLPVGLLGVMEYYRAGKISADNIKAGLWIALGLFVGTYFGSRFAVNLPVGILRKAFAVFLVAVAFRIWFK